MAALPLGNGKGTSEPGSNPNANSSSGSNGDKSGPPCKISGTRNSFKGKGANSGIIARGGIYGGYRAGFTDDKRAAQEDFADAKRAASEDHDRREVISGTDGSFIVEDGCKIDVGNGCICSGALSRGKKASTSMPRSIGDVADIEPRSIVGFGDITPR